MFYYRVTHKYMLFDHIEKKDIGIYSSLEKANMEINLLQDKNGFKETKDCFFVKKVFKFTKPKLLDKTFWIDGFDTYYYVENMAKKISCDETRRIMKHFSFLIKEYGFKFDITDAELLLYNCKISSPLKKIEYVFSRILVFGLIF